LLDGVTLLANSRCTAGVISQCLGRDSTVLTPLIDREAYRTSGSRRYVTRVNPRRVKDGHTAFELAQACPDIPFAFVEAWTEKEDLLTSLRDAARRLPNVKWRRPTLRTREVYGATRILLAASGGVLGTRRQRGARLRHSGKSPARPAACRKRWDRKAS
jgi:hypothetical protein